MFFALPFARAWAVPLTWGVPFGCEIAMLTMVSLVASSIYVIAKQSGYVGAEPIPFARESLRKGISLRGLMRVEVMIKDL